MCLCCCVKEDSYGEVLPGVFLVRATIDYFDDMKAGQWGLVFMNDPFVIFDHIVEDPYFGMSDEEVDADTTVSQTTYDNFIHELTSFREKLKVTPYEGFRLYQEGLKAGYNPDSGEFGYWLYERLAQYIKTATVTHFGEER